MPSEVPYYVDDFTLLPVIVRQHQRMASGEEFMESLASMKGCLDGPGQVGFVLSFAPGVNASHSQRKILAKWLDDNRTLLEQESYGVGLVLTSAAKRFILASILLITTMPGRIRTCASIDDGIAHVVQAIVDTEGVVPPPLRRYLAKAETAASA